MYRGPWLALLVLLFLPAPLRAQSSAKPWERMVVIGASSSAGYGASEAARTSRTSPVCLAEFCDKMIRGAHQPVENLASELFFMSPEKEAEMQVAKALELKPSSVVAVDFLFWFGYGKKSDEARLKDLESGLALLERFTCPLILAAFPDMSAAIGGMLSQEMVPAKEVLRKLNDRIALWARLRKNVLMIPLSEMLESARVGRNVKAGRSEWKDNPLQALLQKDQLHPTVEGLAAIAALSLESLMHSQKIDAEAFNLDARAVAALVLKQAEARAIPRDKK